jgi:hypothetical protein
MKLKTFFSFIMTFVTFLTLEAKAQTVSTLIDYPVVTSNLTKEVNTLNKGIIPINYSFSSGLKLTTSTSFVVAQNFTKTVTEEYNYQEPRRLVREYLTTHEGYKLITFAAVPYIRFTSNKYGSVEILHFEGKTSISYELSF